MLLDEFLQENIYKQFDDRVFSIPHCFRHRLATVEALEPFDEELILKLLLKLVKHNESSS